MTQFDSLLAAFSQSLNAQPKPPAWPQGDSGVLFAQIWSEQTPSTTAPQMESLPAIKLASPDDPENGPDDADAAKTPTTDGRLMPVPTIEISIEDQIAASGDSISDRVHQDDGLTVSPLIRNETPVRSASASLTEDFPTASRFAADVQFSTHSEQVSPVANGVQIPAPDGTGQFETTAIRGTFQPQMTATMTDFRSPEQSTPNPGSQPAATSIEIDIPSQMAKPVSPQPIAATIAPTSPFIGGAMPTTTKSAEPRPEDGSPPLRQSRAELSFAAPSTLPSQLSASDPQNSSVAISTSNRPATVDGAQRLEANTPKPLPRSAKVELTVTDVISNTTGSGARLETDLQPVNKSTAPEIQPTQSPVQSTYRQPTKIQAEPKIGAALVAPYEQIPAKPQDGAALRSVLQSADPTPDQWDAQRPARQTTPTPQSSPAPPPPTGTIVPTALPFGTHPPRLDAGNQLDIPLGFDVALAPASQTQTIQQVGPTVAVSQTYAPQVAQQITTAIVQSSGGKTEIMLNPEELGRVRIAMTAGDAGLMVTILAERPETTDLMRRNIEHLTRELRDMGYDNPTFNFEDQSGGSNDAWDENAPHSGAPTNLPVIETPNHTTQRVALSGGLDLKL